MKWLQITKLYTSGLQIRSNKGIDTPPLTPPLNGRGTAGVAICVFRAFRCYKLLSCFPCERTLVLSGFFAVWRVLAAFFLCCGTWVHRRREMGLNRMAGDNQWVGKGCFDERSQESVRSAWNADKRNKEWSRKLKVERGKLTWRKRRRNVEHRPMQRGASEEKACGGGFFLRKRDKMM